MIQYTSRKQFHLIYIAEGTWLRWGLAADDSLGEPQQDSRAMRRRLRRWCWRAESW